MDRDLPPAPEPLPAPVADSHCHLDVVAELSGLEPGAALDRAAEANVTRVVQVGCDVGSSRWAVQAAQRWPGVVASVALHPNDAARAGDRLGADLAEIERLLTAPDPERRIRGVGETGLDHFRTRDDAGQARQVESFAAHIALAKQFDKTLVIHDRDAHQQILDVLDAEGCPDRIVMHCFSGDAAFARSCLDRGAWLSFPGTVTFKPNHDLREACRVTPAERLLTETDAPFLTPMPYRGRPNASYLIPHTVRFMAELRGEDLGELCAALDAATTGAFGRWDAARS